MNGADFEMPYKPISASGPNASILHYRPSSKIMRNGELLLCDMGCQIQEYACDISRTYPVSGIFSKEQRELYTVVLEAQKAAIEQARAGTSFLEADKASSSVIVDGLARLGLIRASAARLSESD